MMFLSPELSNGLNPGLVTIKSTLEWCISKLLKLTPVSIDNSALCSRGMSSDLLSVNVTLQPLYNNQRVQASPEIPAPKTNALALKLAL